MRVQEQAVHVIQGTRGEAVGCHHYVESEVCAGPAVGRSWHELVTVEDGAPRLVRGILGVWAVDAVFAEQVQTSG